MAEINPLCPVCGDSRDTSICPPRSQESLEEDVGLEKTIDQFSIDELWQTREILSESLSSLSQEKGRIDQELRRRVELARPDFDEHSSGAAELAGDRVLVKMTYIRDYKDHDEVVPELMESGLLNTEEIDQLLETHWKVRWQPFAQLKKRGGALAEILGRLRTLDSARPQFKGEARK